MINARTVAGVHTHTHTHTGNLKEIKNIIKKIEILSLCSNWV